MGTYVSLVNFTDQGIRVIRNTVERAESFRTTAEQMGVTVKDIFWTLGVHDLVIIVEAPDDETVATLFFSLGSLGNIRAHTLRAFGRLVPAVSARNTNLALRSVMSPLPSLSLRLRRSASARPMPVALLIIRITSSS